MPSSTAEGAISLQIPFHVRDPEYREYLLLPLLAEISEFELKIERPLQCACSGMLLDEWRADREREPQKTWHKVHRYELHRARPVQEEQSISPSRGISVGYPHSPDVVHPLARTHITPVRYPSGDGVNTSRPISIQRMPPFAS